MTTTKALTYVEIDIPFCALTYASAPCAAVLGVTGDAKCFNSIASCQDRDNFDESTVTLRFAEDTGHNPAEIEYVAASLVGVAVTPGRISLGEDLGQRTSVSFSFEDHRHSDTGEGFDKYLGDRAYDPFSQGTFWGKFRARQPFLKGRSVRLIRGVLGQALAEMETHHYVIESFDGPSVDGTYTLVAKDILKILDGDRAQAPSPTPGFLTGALTNSGTSATLSPSGAGDLYYPASGKVAIGGKEIASFTRSGDALTLTRGQNNTTAIAHSAGDRVQLVLSFTSEDPADIIHDLMVDYGGVDEAFIPLTDWQAETAAFNRKVYSTVIAEPTPVRKLVSELVLQAGLAIWWDDVLQLIKLQVLRAIATNAATYSEDVWLEDSFAHAEQPEKRISQVWTYYGQRNALEGQEDASNYRSRLVTEDADAELDNGVAAIKKIFSRWIPFGGSSIAARINAIQIGRYRVAPRRFNFRLLRTPEEGIRLGSGYQLAPPAGERYWPLQNLDGTGATVPIQVTQLGNDSTKIAVEAEEMLFTSLDEEDLNNRQISINADIENLNLKDLHDQIYPEAVGGEEVHYVLESSVVVGSTSTSLPSIDVGDWPKTVMTGNRTSGSAIITGLSSTATFLAGMAVTGTGIPVGSKILTVDSGTQVTLDHNASSGAGTATSLTFWLVRLTFDLKGTLIGAGGPGGRGYNQSGPLAEDGFDGGIALYVRSAIDLLVALTGKLLGGAGGGAGSRQNGGFGSGRGGGGGGGAGRVAGTGGDGPDQAEAGTSGSLTAGGTGGQSWNGSGLVGSNRGGDGGAPGTAGGLPDQGTMVGGDPGAALDGASFVDLTNLGTITGPQVN